MTKKKDYKKVRFSINLWEEIEVFSTQNYIEGPQEALRFLIARGLKAHNNSFRTPLQLQTTQDIPLIKNCCLSSEQWNVVEDFKFANRLDSMSEAVRALVVIGLEHEKSLGMYVPK